MTDIARLRKRIAWVEARITRFRFVHFIQGEPDEDTNRFERAEAKHIDMVYYMLKQYQTLRTLTGMGHPAAIAKKTQLVQRRLL